MVFLYSWPRQARWGGIPAAKKPNYGEAKYICLAREKLSGWIAPSGRDFRVTNCLCAHFHTAQFAPCIASREGTIQSGQFLPRKAYLARQHIILNMLTNKRHERGVGMNTENTTRVIILTGHYRIVGDISLLPGARITDFLAESKEFFAVTNAEVWDLNGRKISACRFIDINREHIEIIMPENATK